MQVHFLFSRNPKLQKRNSIESVKEALGESKIKCSTCPTLSKTESVKQAYNKCVRSVIPIPNLHAASVKVIGNLFHTYWQPGFTSWHLGTDID